MQNSSDKPHVHRLKPLLPAALAFLAMQDGVPVASGPWGRWECAPAQARAGQPNCAAGPTGASHRDVERGTPPANGNGAQSTLAEVEAQRPQASRATESETHGAGLNPLEFREEVLIQPVHYIGVLH